MAKAKTIQALSNLLKILLHKPPVVVELLQKSPSSSGLYPLTVTMTPMTTPTLVLPVTFDLIGLFCNDIDTRLVAKQLRNRLQEQIKLIAQTIMVDKATNDQDIHSVFFFHFNLPNQHVPITIPYPDLPLSTDIRVIPSPLPDSSLLSLRTKLHQTFCLPTNRPFLRKTNRQWSPWKQEARLFDPHVSLNLTEGGDGLALVNGSYLYYHYMQEKFNDKGWGCAYRSLQTIWSWFRCQGYTDAPVPTHREIQQTLVDCGDKEKPFIGSSEWIGSIEVSTVLSHSLQIESRIHHCSRGADIAGTGRLLQHHFRNQGTPVMIGGGVLAHTILGVDYDEQSGDIKFLILDPHYTGPEDINLINGKGCGWKRMNFWDQNASYNLCMPIRPQEI
ncbi:PREDICTED: ufm1-specific protease 2-like isoform X3 [Amphimedon queenslandica]|uniref:Ufm1-specific protease 2 n=1 Tax=Amphimedon queenslandica TaxID=400682 RepID=A0AAN0K0C7_AMPQE|nr:PREDICTED: ufm1-specific protease 2-like isoform X3 [Amphimedon queenslandica]|eukprot:XP_019862617.1 PREDICTED: ufm1-specific protease 2-like isoform X3 [Amphimedon queenslandica]